jgi:hypothetical protein
MKQVHPEQNPKSMSHEITQGNRGGKRDADDEHNPERLDQVADPACQRRRQQSHGGAGAKQDS